LSQLVGVASLLLFFRGTAVLVEQQLGLPRRGYCSMHPVDTARSSVAELEDVRVLLPHPPMREYGYVVVVADDKVLIEATVEDPSGFGEGLLYLLRGDVALLFLLEEGMISHCQRKLMLVGANRVHTLGHFYRK
jgi:hypothetical protein